MATTPNPATDTTPQRVKVATEASVKAISARDQKRIVLDTLKAELAAVQAEQTRLSQVLAPVRSAAWCVDLTETATGVVATVDIPDEGKLALIAPGAPAPVAADGALAAREAMKGHQVYWCAAALPGLQKWRPQYRRGTITALDTGADTADVTLDSTDTSSASSLTINQTPALSAVPVQYMTCNAQAFEVGDRCVVRFVNRDWAQPRVIGFESNPKSCGVPDLHLVFVVPTVARSASDTVAIFSTGGVNNSGTITNTGSGGVFHSLGIVLETNLVSGGVEINDVSATVTYRILSFYDGHPLQSRRETSSSVVIGPILPLVPPVGAAAQHQVHTYTSTIQTKVSRQAQVLTDGSLSIVNQYDYEILQPPYVSEPNSLGNVIWQRTTETYADYWNATNIDDGTAAHPATLRPTGPWASWSAFASYILDGASEYYPDTSTLVSNTIASTWQKDNLPVPKAGLTLKPRADLALMPARTAVGTVIPYLSSTFAATPLDRHILDFGYLPYTIDTLKVYAVAKNIAWCWLTANPIPGAAGAWVNIAAVNFKTGVTVNITAPEFWKPSPVPSNYIPPNVVFSDTWAALCKNDPTDPYFWVWVYTLAAGALTLTKTITNKPGDLSAGGHVGLVQVATPSLPANSYLIGAMRDEVSAM